MTVLLAHRLAVVAGIFLVAGFLFLCREVVSCGRYQRGRHDAR